MMSPLQRILGADWERLPPALRAHHGAGMSVDRGHLDIAFPSFMQPWLTLLNGLGALIDQRGRGLATVVEKRVDGERQIWQRTVTLASGQTLRFDSIWIPAGERQFIEFVNPLLGLQMAVRVEGDRLHYRSVRYVLKLGRRLLTLPGWALIGHADIVEEAIGDDRFGMDFRLRHPLFGEVYRYAGTFTAEHQCEHPTATPPPYTNPR